MTPDERRTYAVACMEKHQTNRLKFPLSVMASAVGATTIELREAADPTYRRKKREVKVVEEDSDEHEGASPAEYEARRREKPEDTRSEFARLLGDPIPGDTRRQRYGNDYNARGGGDYRTSGHALVQFN
jgi:hypothetical protein